MPKRVDALRQPSGAFAVQVCPSCGVPFYAVPPEKPGQLGEALDWGYGA